MISALVLCLAAPLFAQDPARDGIAAANWQKRLDLGRDQVRSGQFSPEAFKQQEKETGEYIAKLRARNTGLDRLKFEYSYFYAQHDDAYRMTGPAAPDKSPFDPIPIMAICFFAFIGFFILRAIYFKPSNTPAPAPAGPPPVSDTYGSARFADPAAFMPDQMYVFNGVFFGKASSPGPHHLVPFERHQGGPVCSTPENHSLVVARTRTGKFTRICAATLLRGYLGSSAIVIDPKGENAAVTARIRQEPVPGFKTKVYIVNPWGVLAPTFQQLGFSPATFNPLDVLDRDDPNAVAIAQAIAAAICPAAQGKDSFWAENAASLLTAVLLWLTDQPGEQKTLGRAREIVSLPRKVFSEKFLSKMLASGAFEGAIRENAGPFMDMADETYSGVISNLSQHTKFLSDPQVKRATAVSSFSMKELLTGPTTVYVVVPPDRIDTQRTWLRLLITAGMQTYKNRPLGVPVSRCLFLIDEFPALGRLDELPRDIATMSGYGVDFCLIVQGLNQLKDVYGDAHGAILSNCAYKWFCNVNDLQSAEYLSKTLGKKTVQTKGSSTSEGFGPGGASGNQGSNLGETGRDLLMPDEILNLGRDTAILLAPGTRPHYLRPVDYWQLPEAFAHMQKYYPYLYWQPPLIYDPNPYHSTRQLTKASRESDSVA